MDDGGLCGASFVISNSDIRDEIFHKRKEYNFPSCHKHVHREFREPESSPTFFRKVLNVELSIGYWLLN
jgi:hypothetical protein